MEKRSLCGTRHKRRFSIGVSNHGSARVPRWSVPGTAGVGVWQGGPCGEGADLAPIWPLTVGDTGADPAHDVVAPQADTTTCR
jgi:hypothetical protein